MQNYKYGIFPQQVRLPSRAGIICPCLLILTILHSTHIGKGFKMFAEYLYV